METPTTLELNCEFKLLIKSPTTIGETFTSVFTDITVEPTPTVALSAILNFSKDVAVPTLLNAWKNVLLPFVGSGNLVSGLEEYVTSV